LLSTILAAGCFLAQSVEAAEARRVVSAKPSLTILGEAIPFLPGIASTEYSEIRLTLSPDGNTALWFSRDRPGGAGGYDIWISRRHAQDWTIATPVPFNSPQRDFDPAFSADGRHVYFCSDRPGGHGGDDLYRIAVTEEGFGAVEHLGAAVNSAGNEFAPMLSPDGRRLLFSSDRPGGAGGHDLFTASQRADLQFESAQRLQGGINTRANEFDASFLSDGASLVFARAMDFRADRVDMFFATLGDGRYGVGTPLPQSVNSGEQDTYGAMLDWSQPDRFTVSARKAGAPSPDLYLVRYRLERADGRSSAILPLNRQEPDR
jgi:Tol biopolymer transport system component